MEPKDFADALRDFEKRVYAKKSEEAAKEVLWEISAWIRAARANGKTNKQIIERLEAWV